MRWQMHFITLCINYSSWQIVHVGIIKQCVFPYYKGTSTGQRQLGKIKTNPKVSEWNNIPQTNALCRSDEVCRALVLMGCIKSMMTTEERLAAS